MDGIIIACNDFFGSGTNATTLLTAMHALRCHVALAEALTVPGPDAHWLLDCPSRP
jgi:hypothetical protein